MLRTCVLIILGAIISVPKVSILCDRRDGFVLLLKIINTSTGIFHKPMSVCYDVMHLTNKFQINAVFLDRNISRKVRVLNELVMMKTL